MNCSQEKLTFERTAGSGAVLSAAGTLTENRQIGYAVRNGTTFVWRKVSDSGVAACMSKIDFFLTLLVAICSSMKVHKWIFGILLRLRFVEKLSTRWRGIISLSETSQKSGMLRKT